MVFRRGNKSNTIYQLVSTLDLDLIITAHSSHHALLDCYFVTLVRYVLQRIPE